MALTSTSTTTLLPSYYDRLLLDNLYPDLYLYQFGQKRRIPRNFGKQVTFTRYFKAATGVNMPLPAALTEGVPTFTSNISAATITATVAGYGSAIAVSDFIVMTAVSDVVQGAVYELSRGMALRVERIIRAVVSSNGATIGAKNATLANSGLTSTTSVIDVADLYKATAKLRQNDARTWPDGNFAAIMHPRVAYDVRNDTGSLSGGGWLDINKYATDNTVGNCYRGEVGRIAGIRVVESTEAKRLVGAPISTNASGFMTVICGPGAYGVVELDGASASVFVKQVGSAGSADPVNQKGTVGVKVYMAAVALEAAREVRINSGGALL